MTELESLLGSAARGPDVGFDAGDIERRVRRRATIRRAGTAVLAAPVVVGLTVWAALALSGSDDRRVEVADGSGTGVVDGGLVGRWTPTAYSAVVAAEPGGYLEFGDDGRLEGSDGCTTFGARWAVSGSRLMVDDIGWTSTCGPANDTGLLEILNGDPTIGASDLGALQLTSGSEFAVFERAEVRTEVTIPDEIAPGSSVTTSTTRDGAVAPTAWVGHDQQRLVVVDPGSGDVRVLEQLDDPDDVGDEPLEPVAGGSFLGDIAVSPDGTAVYWEQCCEPAPGVIFRTPIGGGEAEQVTLGAFPAVSPDGSTLAVVELQWLSLVDLATGDVRRIASTGEAPTALANPTWSRDGTSLAFERYDDSVERGWIMVVDVTATSLDTAREVAAHDEAGTPMLPTYDARGRLHLVRQHGGLGPVRGPAEAVVVDATTGSVVSRRAVGAVREQDHDRSGTSLLRTFADGTVEHRTQDGSPVVLGEGYLSASW